MFNSYNRSLEYDPEPNIARWIESAQTNPMIIQLEQPIPTYHLLPNHLKATVENIIKTTIQSRFLQQSHIDHIEACEWLAKATSCNDADTQQKVGIIYRDGKGVAIDYKKALEWFKKAANQDNSDA